MIKHIFSDLDGTLLLDFKTIRDEDIKALKNAFQQGITVSIATGRQDKEIKGLMEKFGLKGYRISQNGGVVFSLNDELLYEKRLATADILKIISALKGYHVLLLFETASEYIVEERIQLLVDFEKTQPYIQYIENRNIFNELDQYEFVTVSIWAEENENIKIKNHLDEVLPPYIVSYISSQFTIDITMKDNSKGAGIERICKRNHIDFNEIAVIGDSYNDISMFQLTPHSFVMANADEEVKKQAGYTVESVAKAVEWILSKR